MISSSFFRLFNSLWLSDSSSENQILSENISLSKIDVLIKLEILDMFMVFLNS